ncbi:MAG: hypothetical protein ACKVJU_23170 [Verrucomicrobiales bacterium]
MFDESTLLDRGKRLLLLLGFLGLDAPVVFISWLILFSKSTGHPVPSVVFAAAFLAIWSIYLFDRIVDLILCKDWDVATERLRFGKKHRLFFGVALVVSTGFGAAIAIVGHLPQEVLIRGLWVVLGVAIYFGVFVMPPFFRRSKFPGKEFGVGLAFAGGIIAAIGFHSPHTLALVAFGSAAAFNCLLIASRDRDADATNDSGSASQWWGNLRQDLNRSGLIYSTLTLNGFFLPPNQWPLFICLCISSVLMTLLNRNSARLSGAEVRAYADFCLLTPFIGIWFA